MFVVASESFSKLLALSDFPSLSLSNMLLAIDESFWNLNVPMSPLRHTLWVQFFWLGLESSLFVPSFPPCWLLLFMEFAKVSSTTFLNR
jgi:hypothetical protein